jgi:hypothetical protein
MKLGPQLTAETPEDRRHDDRTKSTRTRWSIWDLCPAGRGRFACRCSARDTLCPIALPERRAS